MKTIEEFTRELESSAELWNEYETINEPEALEAFLRKNGCEATADEFFAFQKANTPEEGAISDNEAEAVAGGLPGALTKKLKLPLRCVNRDCKEFYKPYLFKLSGATQYCSECGQPMSKY